MKYKVTLLENFTSTFEIEGDNEADALEKARKKYEDGDLCLKDIVLDNAQFIVSKFDAIK